MSHSESGTHRNRWNGTTSSVKVVSRPRLVGVSAQGERLDVTVGTRLGQTVADLEAVAPALADAAGAHSVRAVSEAPGIALAYAFDVVERRGRALAGHSRKHTPQVGDPLVVLLIDEMAALTSYMQDKEAKKEADRLLRSILTKGRAVGVVVVGALQDPRKETLAARELFTQTVALRLRSKSEVAMVLGEGMAETAPAHRIRTDQQGMAYVVVDDGTTQRIRAGFAPDSLIRQCAATYGTHRTIDLSEPVTDTAQEADPSDLATDDASTTAEPASKTSPEAAKAPASGRKPRAPRKPRNRTRATSGAGASGGESA